MIMKKPGAKYKNMCLKLRSTLKQIAALKYFPERRKLIERINIAYRNVLYWKWILSTIISPPQNRVEKCNEYLARVLLLILFTEVRLYR